MIVFNKPKLAGDEIKNIIQALENGQLAGDGPFTQSCESKLNLLLGTNATLLTHSCTAALEMAALLLDISDGDEVIMPSYTFVSTANAIALRGGVPVFVDIRADTLNIDEGLIEDAITQKTKAIFVVHYAGVPCEMDIILAIAKKHKLYVVEDAAQALTSTYKQRSAGSIGDLSCFSFHETKNIISGEGGCLCINNPIFLERAEIIREKGTNRKNFFKGVIDKYTWVDLGSSYIPGELIAAFLDAQLDKVNEIQQERILYWNRYHEAFSELENRKKVRRPSIPANVQHNAHLYYLILDTSNSRDELIQFLKERGIVAPFHYIPLHQAPAGEKLCRSHRDLSITENLSSRLLRLPLFPGLNTSQDIVIKSVCEFMEG